MNRALVVMVREPVPGNTKTRLLPHFSTGAVAELYSCFISDVTTFARKLPGVTLLLAFWPPSAEAYFRDRVPGFNLLPQQGTSLSERLNGVMSRCTAMGFDQVVAMASDCPNLPLVYLSQAFVRLDDDNVDLVFGPCDDGGYYLIGWKHPVPRVILDVEMSTPQVLTDTLAVAAEEKLSVALLPSWYDVDTLDDLARLVTDLAENESGAAHTRHFLATRLSMF